MRNPTPTHLTCVICGLPFAVKWRNIKVQTCSQDCKSALMRQTLAARTVPRRKPAAKPPKTLICIVCGADFLAVPRKPRKTCSEACHTSHLSACAIQRHVDGRHTPTPRKRSIINCEICGREIEILTSAVGKRRVCGRECSIAIQKSITGTDHPLYKPKVTMACEVCGKLCQVKPSLVSRFRNCSRNCVGTAVTLRQPRVSSIEVMVASVLATMGVAYRQQVKVATYVPDFVVGSTIIEVDGTYWHGMPKVKERDAVKDRIFRDLGYEVIRITEADIRAGNFAALDGLNDTAIAPGQQSLFFPNDQAG